MLFNLLLLNANTIKHLFEMIFIRKSNEIDITSNSLSFKWTSFLKLMYLHQNSVMKHLKNDKTCHTWVIHQNQYFNTIFHAMSIVKKTCFVIHECSSCSRCSFYAFLIHTGVTDIFQHSCSVFKLVLIGALDVQFSSETVGVDPTLFLSLCFLNQEYFFWAISTMQYMSLHFNNRLLWLYIYSSNIDFLINTCTYFTTFYITS